MAPAIEWQAQDLSSLGQELQDKMTKVYQAFSGRMAAAKDPTEGERLKKRYNQLINEIEQGFQTRAKAFCDAATANGGALNLYNKGFSDLDLDLIVYDGDRDVLKDLLSDIDFAATVNRLMVEFKPFNSRKQLLSKALKITRSMAPQVYEIIDHCSSALKMNSEIEIYVYQDNFFNACCYPPQKDKVLLMMTSALLEKFTPKELTFVIGHELGHYLFEHTRFPVDYILQHGRDFLSPLHAMKLYSWIRNSEITADRVGLMCCQDFNAVAGAFFKLASGISGGALDFRLAEYIDQLKEIQMEMETAEHNPEDWYSTHPFSPIRIRALELFHKSQTYFQLVGQSGGEISEEQMELEIKALMSIMEPVYMKGNSDSAQKTQRLILNGGYLIAAADGRVEPEEIQALAGLLGPQFPSSEIKETARKTLENVQQDFITLAQDVNHLLPPSQKLQVIENLSVISFADGSVHRRELETLYWISESLRINPSFVDNVLARVKKGVD